MVSLDQSLFRHINSLAGHSAWDSFFVFLTIIGYGGAIWAVLALVLLLGARRQRDNGGARLRAAGAAMIVALLLAWGTESTLKAVFARPRPPVALPHVTVLGYRPESYSFPSGHALSSFAAAGVMAAANRADAWLPLTLAVLIGFSRIWVGHHYPLDVAAGTIMGLIIGWITWHAMVRLLVPRRMRAPD
ncbi:MAG TPA: phosphatase PAP2 family protein [Symbiobacteriaceae bacterium]|nr:phosphatase PAP2 family protein [Symbiobacteriaceae bacterium]